MGPEILIYKVDPDFYARLREASTPYGSLRQITPDAKIEVFRQAFIAAGIRSPNAHQESVEQHDLATKLGGLPRVLIVHPDAGTYAAGDRLLARVVVTPESGNRLTPSQAGFLAKQLIVDPKEGRHAAIEIEEQALAQKLREQVPRSPAGVVEVGNMRVPIDPITVVGNSALSGHDYVQIDVVTVDFFDSLYENARFIDHRGKSRRMHPVEFSTRCAAAKHFYSAAPARTPGTYGLL